VDTSVVIAGAAAFPGRPLKPDTPSGKFLLDWLESGHFTWLYSEEVLAEYKEVMSRLGVRSRAIGSLINLLRETGELVHISSSVDFSPDPTDNPLCNCAEQGGADFLVTLNQADFPQHRLRAKVIGPADSFAQTRRRKSGK